MPDGPRSQPDLPPIATETEGLQGLFELSLAWAIFWAGCIGIGWAVYFLLGRLEVGASIATAVAGLTTLVTGIVALWVGDRTRWLEFLPRYIHKYAFALTLATGLVGGWFYRNIHEPDPDRSNAERAAVRACVQMTGCLNLAAIINGGNDVEPYLPPHN
jgi:hypothetical protein